MKLNRIPRVLLGGPRVTRYLLVLWHAGGSELHHHLGELSLHRLHVAVQLVPVHRHDNQPPEVGAGGELAPPLAGPVLPVGLFTLRHWDGPKRKPDFTTMRCDPTQTSTLRLQTVHQGQHVTYYIYIYHPLEITLLFETHRCF